MNTRVLRLVFTLLLLALAPGTHPAEAEEQTSIQADFYLYLPVIAKNSPPPAAPIPDCAVVYQNPPNFARLPLDTAFTYRWILKNTSKNTWLSHIVKIRFMGGARLHTGSDILDLPYDVTPGGMIDFAIPMRTPSQTGVYVSNWSIFEVSKSLCGFYASISAD